MNAEQKTDRQTGYEIVKKKNRIGQGSIFMYGKS